MARAAKKESVDVLVEKALDRGLSDTKDIIAAVLKAKPRAPRRPASRAGSLPFAKSEGWDVFAKPVASLGAKLTRKPSLIFILRQGGVEKAKASLAKLLGRPGDCPLPLLPGV